MLVNDPGLAVKRQYILDHDYRKVLTIDACDKGAILLPSIKSDRDWTREAENLDCLQSRKARDAEKQETRCHCRDIGC
jgi:hypothetical protein